jgi:hypothetical protein
MRTVAIALLAALVAIISSEGFAKVGWIPPSGKTRPVDELLRAIGLDPLSLLVRRRSPPRM